MRMVPWQAWWQISAGPLFFFIVFETPKDILGILEVVPKSQKQVGKPLTPSSSLSGFCIALSFSHLCFSPFRNSSDHRQAFSGDNHHQRRRPHHSSEVAATPAELDLRLPLLLHSAPLFLSSLPPPFWNSNDRWQPDSGPATTGDDHPPAAAASRGGNLNPAARFPLPFPSSSVLSVLIIFFLFQSLFSFFPLFGSVSAFVFLFHPSFSPVLCQPFFVLFKAETSFFLIIISIILCEYGC